MAYPIRILPTKLAVGKLCACVRDDALCRVSCAPLSWLWVLRPTTLISSMVGFAFARYHVPGSKQLFTIIIALLIVPGIVTLIPQFLVYARLS